jgi:hypothetical protein
VLDFDALCVAVGSRVGDHHRMPHASVYKLLARGVWGGLRDDMVKLSRRGVRVWIIHAFPSDRRLGEYHRLGRVVKL